MNVENKMYTVNGKTYKVFSDGTILGDTGKPLKHRQNADGYAVVTLGCHSNRKVMHVHRIVAQLFLPNPDVSRYTDVDHLDSNRMNPAVWNLEWVTHEENVKRSFFRGNHAGKTVGEKNPRARLNEKKVLELRKEYRQGKTINELAISYCLPWSTVSNAVKYVTWTHIA